VASLPNTGLQQTWPRFARDQAAEACYVRQADLNPEHASAVRLALSRYLSRTDERDAPYRALARNYGLLPVLPD
jgi:hypothetical protein